MSKKKKEWTNEKTLGFGEKKSAVSGGLSQKRKLAYMPKIC